jgi:hypothetical protein
MSSKASLVGIFMTRSARELEHLAPGCSMPSQIPAAIFSTYMGEDPVLVGGTTMEKSTPFSASPPSWRPAVPKTDAGNAGRFTCAIMGGHVATMGGLVEFRTSERPTMGRWSATLGVDPGGAVDAPKVLFATFRPRRRCWSIWGDGLCLDTSSIAARVRGHGSMASG